MYYIYYIIGRLRRKYFMQLPETEDDLKKSRRWLIVDSSTANVIGQLIGGTFLAALLKTLGVSDALNGIISSVVTSLALSQLLSGVITSRFRKKKPVVCLFGVMHRLMLSASIIIPYMNWTMTVKLTVFVILYITGLLMANIMSPPANAWIAKIIPKETPGIYLGRREMIIVITIMITNFLCGCVLDYFKGAGTIRTGFLILGIFSTVCAFINIYALSQIKEPSEESLTHPEEHGRKYKRIKNEKKTDGIIKSAVLFLKDSKIRRTILIFVIWQAAFQISTAYINIYQISELNFSYTFIMACGIIFNLLRITATPLCSRYMNKHGSMNMLILVCIIMSSSYLINSFAVPENGKILYIISASLVNIGYGGTGISHFTIQMQSCSENERTMLFGITATLTGISGFVASVIGGVILAKFQGGLQQITGIYGQQLLSFISFILLAVLTLYVINLRKSVKYEQ